MSKQKKQYCVWYEVVNEQERKTEKRILKSGLDWRTAHMVKRNHQKICAMHVSRWMPCGEVTK